MEKNIELARFIDTLEERRMNDGVSHLYNEKDGGFYFMDEKGNDSFIVTSADEPDMESINQIEAFLTGTMEIRLSRARKKELKAEYRLKRNRYGFYTTSDTFAFEILCAKYDRARYYRSWSDLYFAMRDDRREWEYSWRKEVIAKEPDAEALQEVEGFLTDGVTEKTSKERRIISEYCLGPNRWGKETTEKKLAFKILSSKFYRAKYYQDWDDLYLAMVEDRREWEIPWRAAI